MARAARSVINKIAVRASEPPMDSAFAEEYGPVAELCTTGADEPVEEFPAGDEGDILDDLMSLASRQQLDGPWPADGEDSIVVTSIVVVAFVAFTT